MNKFIHSNTDWSMELLNQNFPNIYLDLSFQRMACWSEKAKKSYINSILNGAHPGYLILASVHANAYRNEYFKSLQENNMQYLSIDGNNRSTCIVEFMNDKFAVKVNGKYKVYSELEVNDQAEFRNKRLGIVMYENISKEGCANVFLSHNESQPLSAQEKRNAHIGEISNYFRELEPKVRTKIKTFDSENKRRSNDEFILDTVLTEISPSLPIGKKMRDEFWFDNLKELKLNKTSLKETLDLLGEFLQLKDFGKQSLDGLAKDFIIARGLMKQNNGVVLNKELFLTTLAKKRTELYNSKNAYTIISKRGKEETLQYSTIVSQPTFGPVLAKRSQLLGLILNDLNDLGYITYKTDRYVDTSDPQLRKELFDRQNGICPITGVKIEDPLDGQKWEVDHTIALKNGGLDSIENMQLIDKIENRKKGSSTKYNSYILNELEKKVGPLEFSKKVSRSKALA